MLTFDAIRDIERAEKDSKKMQKLPDDFFHQVSEYFDRKRNMNDKSSADIIEIENIKMIVKRLLELRENKMISMALTSARTGLPPENLTKEEQKVFHSMTENMKDLRTSIFSCFDGPNKPRFRIKVDVPKFVGPDMNVYEFKENQIVDIPKPLSDFLLKEGFIEEIR
jgi:DNA replication initiation complex subunit (GINS family)